LLDQIKKASVNEAASLLASRYVETINKRPEFAKSAEIGSSSLYGAAAGAGVGGLGTLGLDYLTGKGVNARRALYGALIGAVPGAAAGALADTYATPAAIDPKDPPSKSSLTWSAIGNIINPFKVPRDPGEYITGGAGAAGGWRIGGIANNLLGKEWGFHNSNDASNIARVKDLNTRWGKVQPAWEEAKIKLDNLTRAAVGPPTSEAIKAQKEFERLNRSLNRVGHGTEVSKDTGLLSRWGKGIQERAGNPSVIGADPNKFRAVNSSQGLLTKLIGAAGGWGTGIWLDRKLREPITDLFGSRDANEPDK
jgi:hypothetical protein